MNDKLTNALYRKTQQRSRGRDTKEADIPTRVDEHLSSRMCYYCTVQDTARLEDGLEKVLGIASFRSCDHVFLVMVTLQITWHLLQDICYYSSSSIRAGLSGHRDVKGHAEKARLRLNHLVLRYVRVKERQR
ncbi:hypothetical protein VTP01DRAFT_948 [Rhizomucor pusillus]|uniref:uncharacterized protein n=1 Tax=Rhizomucor pusillus TaxID=4840 RepID=UPI003743E474